MREDKGQEGIFSGGRQIMFQKRNLRGTKHPKNNNVETDPVQSADYQLEKKGKWRKENGVLGRSRGVGWKAEWEQEHSPQCSVLLQVALNERSSLHH